MITRYAIFEGHIAPDQRAGFRRAVVERLLPAVRALPEVQSVAANFSLERDEGAPEIAMFLVTTYRDKSSLNAALAGPERRRAQKVTEDIFNEFGHCRIHHHLAQSDESKNS